MGLADRWRDLPADLLRLRVELRQTGGLDSTTEHTIVLTKTSTVDCTGPSGNAVPGGFGWVKPNDGALQRSQHHQRMASTPTPATRRRVAARPADFDALIGKTILIPIFDQ